MTEPNIFEGGVNLHDLYATNTKNKQSDILPFFIALSKNGMNMKASAAERRRRRGDRHRSATASDDVGTVVRAQLPLVARRLRTRSLSAKRK